MTRWIFNAALAVVLVATVAAGRAHAQSTGPWQEYGTEGGPRLVARDKATG